MPASIIIIMIMKRVNLKTKPCAPRPHGHAELPRPHSRGRSRKKILRGGSRVNIFDNEGIHSKNVQHYNFAKEGLVKRGGGGGGGGFRTPLTPALKSHSLGVRHTHFYPISLSQDFGQFSHSFMREKATFVLMVFFNPQ